jgi:hypothetical protein
MITQTPHLYIVLMSRLDKYHVAPMLMGRISVALVLVGQILLHQMSVRLTKFLQHFTFKGARHIFRPTLAFDSWKRA